MADEKKEGPSASLSVSGSENQAPETEKEIDKTAEETSEKIEDIVADAVEDVREEAEECQKDTAQSAEAFLEALHQMQTTHSGMMSDILDRLLMVANRLEELTQTKEPLTPEHSNPPQTPAPAETPETVETVEVEPVAPEKSEAESPVVKKRVRRVI